MDEKDDGVNNAETCEGDVVERRHEDEDADAFMNAKLDSMGFPILKAAKHTNDDLSLAYMPKELIQAALQPYFSMGPIMAPSVRGLRTRRTFWSKII